MKTKNRNIFKLLVVILFGLGLITIVGSGGNDDNDPPNIITPEIDVIDDNDPPIIPEIDDFKIDDHEWLAIPRECAQNAANDEESFETMIESCGFDVIDNSIDMDFEHVYAIKYQIRNDQIDILIINIELIDSNGWVLDHTEFTICDPEESMELFHDYLIWLLDEEPIPGVITIDAWLVDINGVNSDVYSFDIGED